MTIFFLHITKTAGQSFGKAAIKYFGKKHSLLLYGEGSKTTSSIADKIYCKQNHLNQKNKFDLTAETIQEYNIKFFSSHASATLLPCFKPVHTAIILRSPIDRIVSHYNYAIHKGYLKGSFKLYENARSIFNKHISQINSR